MHIDVTRVADPETGETHLCWPRARVTMCGVDKRYWPHAWGDPLQCDDCLAVWLGSVQLMAASHVGRPMRLRKKIRAVA